MFLLIGEHSIKKGIVKITGEGSYGLLRTESGGHVDRMIELSCIACTACT